MATGDIFYVRVAFSDGSGSKRRYTVEIAQQRVSVVLLDAITSKYNQKSDFIKLQYYPIIDWREAGLKKPSYIDIMSYFPANPATIQANQTGQLTERDLSELTKFIQSYDQRLQDFKQSQKPK